MSLVSGSLLAEHLEGTSSALAQILTDYLGRSTYWSTGAGGWYSTESIIRLCTYNRESLAWVSSLISKKY